MSLPPELGTLGSALEFERFSTMEPPTETSISTYDRFCIAHEQRLDATFRPDLEGRR